MDTKSYIVKLEDNCVTRLSIGNLYYWSSLSDSTSLI